MGIRFQTGESYEDWANRVQQYEYRLALDKIANGVPIEEALEWMSKNITAKMLHPLIIELRNTPIDEVEFSESKKQYEEYYVNRVPRAADHVDD